MVSFETRINLEKLTRTLKSLGFDGYDYTQNQGFAGGIGLSWIQQKLNVKIMEKSFQYMHVKINTSHHEEWFFTPIYASPSEENKQDLWRNLKRIVDTMRIGWMVGGYFNDILNANGKREEI